MSTVPSCDQTRRVTLCRARRGPQARDLLTHGNLRPIPDERERVSSKGSLRPCARTESERRLHHASLFLELRLVSARTKSERRLHHAGFFLNLECRGETRLERLVDGVYDPHLGNAV